MAFLDPINTVTVKKIFPGVTDNAFRSSPVLNVLRSNKSSMRQFLGFSWQENFMYDVTPVVGYTPGETFESVQKQLATGTTVTPRYYNASVSAFIEKLKIEMAGDQAVFDYIDLLLQNAALSMSAKLSNDLYRHGQNQGTDRTKLINGLDEALSDGTNNGFLGQTYTSYLTLTRSSLNAALNSPMTAPTANVNGAISSSILEQAFTSCIYGGQQPNLIVTTNSGFSYIKMAYLAQQRFSTSNPELGFEKYKLNGVDVIIDQYAPGARTATAADTTLGYSAVSGGETIWFLNTDNIRLYVAADSLFGFGFTGFLPAQNSSLVMGHYKACLNLTVVAPRTMRYLYNVAS